MFYDEKKIFLHPEKDVSSDQISVDSDDFVRPPTICSINSMINDGSIHTSSCLIKTPSKSTIPIAFAMWTMLPSILWCLFRVSTVVLNSQFLMKWSSFFSFFRCFNMDYRLNNICNMFLCSFLMFMWWWGLCLKNLGNLNLQKTSKQVFQVGMTWELGHWLER